MKGYDLIVIGSGTAAQVAATRVREEGRSVAVIDHRPFGGTCALHGCDPKKVLVGGAEAVDFAGRMQGRGVTGTSRIDWRELIAFKGSFTDQVPAKREQSLVERGIDAYHGMARFAGRQKISVDGRVLEGNHILIASGARPVPLGFPDAKYLTTSDTFMELERLPGHIVMVGGGYIAAEFSHIAARAGAKVTVLQRPERMLPQFDPDLVAWLMEKLAAMGVDVRTGHTVTAVEQTGDGYRAYAEAPIGETSIDADLVVHAACRILVSWTWPLAESPLPTAALPSMTSCKANRDVRGSGARRPFLRAACSTSAATG